VWRRRAPGRRARRRPGRCGVAHVAALVDSPVDALAVGLGEAVAVGAGSRRRRPAPAQIGRRVHGAAAGRLHPPHRVDAVAGCHLGDLAVGAQHCPRRALLVAPRERLAGEQPHLRAGERCRDPRQGSRARTRRSTSAAPIAAQSMRPSSRRSRGASVAAAPSCGCAVAVPRSRPASTSTSSSAPMPASRSVSCGVVSAAPMGVARIAYTGPVSRPASMRMIDTPVCASPARMAAATGDAPRQRGSSEAWTLTPPRRGPSSSASGRIWP